MKTLLSALALSFMAASAGSTQATELRFLVSFDRTTPVTPLIGDAYAKAVEKETNGRYTFRMSGPETVPPFEQFQPVVSGVFQVLLTNSAYHSGTTPLGSLLDGVNIPPDKIASSDLFARIDRAYQKHGLKLIAAPTIAEGGYEVLLRNPVPASGDLKGIKLRSTPTYTNILRYLGASEVVMPNAETYSSLDKGVIDGTAWTAIGITSARFDEVAKFLMRPRFGRLTELLFMNLDTWNGLSAEDKAAFQRAAATVQTEWANNFERLVKEEEDALKAKGVRITKLGDKQAAELPMVWKRGVWDAAAKKAPKEVSEIRALAESKGYLN
jgi:TRAP-type C4-dicarboxylate transport system substrate-binding protein